MEVAQAADDIVAEEIGGSDNDADKTENHVVAMVEKESDCDSDEDSDGFDDEGFDNMDDSDQFYNKMAEEEVMKKLDHFQSDYEWKLWTYVEWISEAKVIKLGLSKLWFKGDCSHLQQLLCPFQEII